MIHNKNEPFARMHIVRRHCVPSQLGVKDMSKTERTSIYDEAAVGPNDGKEGDGGAMEKDDGAKFTYLVLRAWMLWRTGARGIERGRGDRDWLEKKKKRKSWYEHQLQKLKEDIAEAKKEGKLPTLVKVQVRKLMGLA